MGSIDVISVDVLLWCLMLVGLRDVQAKFGHIKEGGVEKDGNNASKRTAEIEWYPERLSERLAWIGRLLTSIRLNGWAIGEPSHDERQPPAPAYDRRMPFVRQALLSFLRGYLTLDLTRAYISYDPYFTDPTISVSAPLPFVYLWPLPPRLVRSSIIAAQAWAAISQMMYLPCLLPVSLNALGFLPDEWSPHTWAPLFGPFAVILLRGVRGFWSQYWHQAMRVMTTAPGYAITDGLGLKRSSFFRYAIITIIAFGLSGIVHMGLVPPQPLYAPDGVWPVRMAIAGFFWLQPVAILLEVLVGRLAVSLSPESIWQKGTGLALRRLLNAGFFVAWSISCLPLLGEMGRQIGYWRVWPVPVSLWTGLKGEGWLTFS